MNIFTRALRNNYLPAFILGILISVSASAQVDTSGKVRQHINAYGFAYKNISIDSSLRIPRDTFHLRYSDTGSIAIVSNILYTWNGLKWNAVAKVVNDSTLIVNGDTVSITASGGVENTDLGYTTSPTNGTVTSSTGTDATIPAADGTNAGLLKPADYNLLQDSVITNVSKTDSIVLYRTKGGTEVLRDTTRSYKGGFGIVQSGYDFRGDTSRSTGLPSYYYTDSISNARNLWQLDGSNNLKPKTFSGSYLDVSGKLLKASSLFLNSATSDATGSTLYTNGNVNIGQDAGIYGKASSNGLTNRFRVAKSANTYPEASLDLNLYSGASQVINRFLWQSLPDTTANFQALDAPRMRIDAYAGDLILIATPITNSVFLNVGTDTLLEAGYGYLNLPKLGGYGNVLVGANDTGRTKRIYIGANLSLSGDTLSATGGGGGGSGTVSNSASANRLAYYAVSGTTVTALAAITGNRALISDANGLPTASSVTNTELGYVSGVTSAIQTQIDGKQPLDADLTSLAGASSTGIYYRSAANTWSLATIGSGLSFTSGTLSATGGGGMAIGSPVTSGTSQSVLYVDGSGNLAQDNSHFKYNSTAKLFTVDSANVSSIAVNGTIYVNGYTGIKIPAGLADAGSSTILGNGAGASMTGVRNTAVGKNALTALMSGYDNSAFGSGALSAASSISNSNVAFGKDAGASNTSGNTNTFLGTSSGATYTSGNSGVFIGYNVRPMYTSGQDGQLNISGSIWGLNTGWNATSPRIGIGVFSSSYPPLWTLHINGSIGAKKDSIPHVTSDANYETLVIDTTTGKFSRITTPAGGGGSGTVTSVSSGNLSPLFTSSVATATTTPAISYSLSNASAYTLFGRNSGTSGAPAYFTPTLASALFANQGTTTTVLHGNASGNPSWGAVSLTADVSGILGAANGGTQNGFTAFTGPTTSTKTFTLPNSSATILTSAAAVTGAQGGTGQTSYTIGDLLYASSTSALSKLAAGTSGYVLTSNGAGTAPSWQAAAGGGISLTTTGTSGAATYSGGTLNVPVYLSAGDRSFFDSTKAGQVYDSVEVSLINSQDVYLKRKSYGSSTWDSAFQFTIPNTSAWDSVIRTTLTTTSTTGDFSNATLSRIVNVPNSTAGTYRIEATCNDGSGHFFTSIKIGHYYKSSGGTLTVGTASAMVTDVNSGLPAETALTIVNSGDNLAFTVTTGTVTAVATGYWKINICLTSNDGPAF